MSGWGDVAASRNSQKIDAYHNGWGAPTRMNNSWKAPGHTRAFHDATVEDVPTKAFTVKKKHGWWGKEEYYDINGRLIR